MIGRGADHFRCRACGSAGGRTCFRSGPWFVVRCSACGLLATWPEPSEEVLDSIYASPEYFGDRSMATRKSAGEGRGRAHHILSLLGVEGPVLDFGAGTGYLVDAMRALGVDATGVEPSRAARAIAAELYGLDLVASLHDVAANRYAAVTMLHVAEHLRDPVETLASLRAVMAPGGRIFIEVPHAGSVLLLPPSRRRAVLDMPAHLHHFTPPTLTRTLARAGFVVETLRLFNPWFVEDLLARRAAPQARPNPPSDAVPAERPTARADPPDLMGALWRRTLRAIRRVAPGDKFQIVAR